MVRATGSRSAHVRYGIAILGVAAAAAIRLALHPILGVHFPYPAFYLAVAAAAWSGGLGPALAAAGLGALAATFLFLPPYGAFGITGVGGLSGLGIYLGVSLAFAWIIVRLRKAGAAAGALRESQDRLRIAVEAGAMGTWEWHIESGRVSWSPGLEMIHGRVSGTFPGSFDAVLKEVHPEDLDRFTTTIRRSLEERSAYQIEYRIVLPDQSIRWLEARGRVFCDSRGTPQYMVGVCMDITERRAAQEALRQAEERYRTMVETANEGVWLLDAEARTVYANRRMAEMLGCDADQLSRREVLEFCFPEDCGAARERIRANLQGTLEQFDFRFRRNDGSELLVFASTSPVRDGNGAVVGLLGLFSDVTARKTAERALRETEERFRQLADNLEDVFWIADPANGRMIYVSPAYEKLWGRAAGPEYANCQAVHPDDRERIRSRFSVSAIESRVDEEYRILRPDGSIRWVRDRALPVRDALGRVRVVGFTEDITERKNAEVALKRSEGKLRALVESAAQGVLAVDGSGRILLVNAKTEELFGYTREELIGQPLEVLVPEQLRRVHAAHRSGYFEHPRTRPMGSGLDLAGRKKDGSTFPVEISLSFVEEEGTSLALALVTDITERKWFEERLRETAKLESLGVLAGGIAHDFNNLLTGILGGASLALEDLPPDHETRQLLEGVVRSGERAAHLTGQMLAYSGKGRFIVEAVDLSELLRKNAVLLESSIPRTVQLRLELSADLPPTEADTSQMQQLVMNLAINAAEAIGDGPGTVLIRTGLRDITGDSMRAQLQGAEITPGRYVFVEVQDTGSGMDEATKTRIFDPFFTTKFTGRGLGLAAALGIVRGHKGAISVDSCPGHGSTFTVYLPAVTAEADAPFSGEAASGLPAPATVLVVDDEEIVRQTAKAVLQKCGYTVVLAGNGQQALEIFIRMASHISVVLLDMTMPVMSGEETLERLRAIRPGVPVVLSSGFNEVEALRRFQGKALAGFLQKPFTATRLAQKIGAVAVMAARQASGSSA
jgi:PAS domain S-box-containing protein